MGLKNTARKLAERLTDTHIYRSLPRGVDPFHDIATYLPNFHAHAVFDVGANLGQSAAQYLARLPDASVFCFEPVQSTFDQLQERFRLNPAVHCYRVACGASIGNATMALQGSSERFFMLDDHNRHEVAAGTPTEIINITTLDDFCSRQHINSISYLKIDTEGNDLDVLKGCTTLLAQKRVDIVEVEAGMNPGNTRHVPFETLKQFLEGYDYLLFGLYEQVREWPTGEPHLRRTNPVFISRALSTANATAVRHSLQ